MQLYLVDIYSFRRNTHNICCSSLEHLARRNVGVCVARNISSLHRVVLSLDIILVAYVVGQLAEGLGVQILGLDCDDISCVAYNIIIMN